MQIYAYTQFYDKIGCEILCQSLNYFDTIPLYQAFLTALA